MLKLCGKIANNLREATGKTGARPSTFQVNVTHSVLATRAKVPFVQKLSRGFTSQISPVKITISPLSEHHFYPVSTTPINNHSQINSKER